jgi:hypothetical protein
MSTQTQKEGTAPRHATTTNGYFLMSLRDLVAAFVVAQDRTANQEGIITLFKL